MSRTVDERVVEMRFDNAQFERNVQTSMSTLDKLKQSLKLSDASKGLENVGKAANKVDFGAMEKSLAYLEKRFSTTGIIGMQVIKNFTNSAMGFVGKVKNFVKGGIVTGGINRAMNLENAQFQLNVLLKDANAVAGVMKNVNDAVDGTAYSLDAAATVASQFAASGMRAGDNMQHSLQAVAGVAALTNSSYEEIGRIFAQISGQGRLMGNDLLQLSTRGMNAAADLAKALGVTEAEVRDMVSKGKISFQEFADVMYQAYGDGAKKANETLKGSMSNLKSAFARIGALFVSPLIKSNGSIVTLFNTLRERVNELKTAIVPVAEKVTTVIEAIINKITEGVKKVGDIIDPIKKAIDIIGKPIGDIADKIDDATDTVNQVTNAIADLGAIVDDVILGKFGNGQARLDALTQSGINYYEVQNKVNEKLGCSFRYTQDQIDAQNKLLGIQGKTVESTSQVASGTEGLTDAQKDLIKQHIKLGDEQLREIGYSEEQIAAFRDLKDIANRLGMPLDDFVDKMDQINAQWLIMDSFKNIGKAIVDVFKTMGRAIKEVFKPLSSDTILNTMMNFHKFSTSLKMTEDTADKLKRTFKGLFALLDIIKTLTGGALSIAFRVFGKVLQNANVSVLDFTARIGDAIVKLRDFLLDNKYINAAVDFITSAIEKISELIGKAIDGLVNNPITQKITSVWDSIFGEAKGEQASGLISSLKALGDQMDIGDDKALNFKTILEGVYAGLDISNWWFVGTLTSNIKLLNAVLSLFGTTAGDVAAKIADLIIQFGNWVKEHTIFMDVMNKLAEVIQTLIVGIEDLANAFLKLEPVQEIIQNFEDLLTKFFGDMSEGFESVNIEGFCNKIKDAFADVEKWILSLQGSEHLGKDIIDGIANGITASMGNVQEAVLSIVDFVKDSFSTLFGNISIDIGNIKLDGLTDCIKDAIAKVKAWVTNFKDSHSIGMNIVLGIVAGIAMFAGGGLIVKAVTAIVNLIKNTFCGLLGIHSPSRWGIEKGKNIVEGIAEGIKAAINLINDAIHFLVGKIVSVFDAGKIKVGDGFTTLFSSVKKVWDNFIALINGIDFKIVLAVIPVGIAVLLAKKIYDLTSTLASGIGGINKVISGFADIEKNFAKVLNAMSMDIKAKAVEKLAISLAILVASLIALTFVDTDKLLACTAILVVLAGILAGLAYAVAQLDSASVKFNKEKGVDISGLKTTLLQIGVVIALLAVSIKLIGTMKPDEVIQGFTGLIGCVTAVAAVLLAFGALAKMDATANIDKAGSMILKVSVAMLLMVGVCKLAAKLQPEEMKKGAIFAAGFAVFVAALAGCYRLAGNGVNKLGSMIIKITIALGLMVGVCKLIGKLSVKEMKKGAAFTSGFTVFVLALKLISQVFPNAKMQKLNGLMLSLSVSLGLMVGVCKLVGLLSVGEMIKGAAFVTGFVLLVGLLVQVTKIASDQKIAKVAGTIMAISVALGAMAAVCVLMGLLTPDMLQKGLLAIAAFGTMMSIMVASARGVTDIKGTVMMMAASIAIMAGSVAVLSFIKPEKLKNATIALSTVMLMFAAIENQAVGINKSAATVAVMAATIAVIGYALYQLADIPAEGAISSAIALSTVMLSLGVTMAIIGDYNQMSVKAMAAVGVMVLALMGMSKAVSMLMGMKGVNDAITIALSLSMLMIGLSTAMVVLSKMSDMAMDTAGLVKFVITISLLTVALGALTPALKSMEKVKWSSLAKAGVALAALALGLNLMNGTMLGSASLLVAAAALRVLSPVLEQLGKMKSESIGNALKALAGSFLILGAAGLILTPVVVPLMLLSVAITMLGVAAMTFGKGIALIGQGLKDVSEAGSGAAIELVSAIETIAVGVLELIPKITSAIAKVVVSVCQVIVKSAPAIGKAVVSVFVSVLQSMADSSAQMLDALSTLIITLLDGLTGKLPDILNSLSNFVVALINGLAEHMPDFITAAVNLVGQIMKGITDNLGPIINDIIVPLLSVFGDIITQVFTAIGPYIPDLVNGFTQIADAVCDMVARIAEALAPYMPNLQAIVEATSQAIQSVCEAFSTLVMQIAPVITAISGLVQQLGSSISQILSALGDAFVQLGNGIRTALDGVADIISSVGGAINDTLTGVADVVRSVGDTIHSVFEGIADIITSVGDSIKNVLDGIADIIDSVGRSALNAGTGFDRLADGVAKITDLSLADMRNSLAAVALGCITIASHSEGLSAAGDGMQSILSSATKSSSAFNSMNNGIQMVLASIQSIGGAASSSMSIMTGSVSSSASCFSALSQSATSASNSMSVAMGIMASSVISNSSIIITAFNTMMTSVVAAIISRSAMFMVAGMQMMGGLRTGITAGSSGMMSAITMVITRSYAIVISKRALFQVAGAQLMQGLTTGLRSGASSVRATISAAMSGCGNTIRAQYTSFKSAGQYLGDGLIVGINSKQAAVYNAAFALGRKAVEGEKAGQKSNSPSKLTIQAGHWLGEGLVIGMQQMGKSVYQTGKSMGSEAVNSISGALNSINDVSTQDLGFSPTIRPVVDMNEIQNGSRSLRIGADLSASLLSQPVSSLQQIVSNAQADINASNNEVIRAINDLRTDLNSLYTSDDSEIALYMDSRKVASTLAKPMNRQLLTLQKRGAY